MNDVYLAEERRTPGMGREWYFAIPRAIESRHRCPDSNQRWMRFGM